MIECLVWGCSSTRHARRSETPSRLRTCTTVCTQGRDIPDHAVSPLDKAFDVHQLLNGLSHKRLLLSVSRFGQGLGGDSLHPGQQHGEKVIFPPPLPLGRGFLTQHRKIIVQTMPQDLQARREGCQMLG